MTWERFTLLFPLWTLLGALLALLHPPLFIWFKGPLIALGLGVIMLGMGVGLTPADFVRVGRRPRAMLLGVLVQFLVMPALAAGIAAALHLPAPLAVGLILVGCCPGGTASNVVALIGRGDVALSVVMTTISTLAAVVLTPRLTQVLASQYVPVDGWALFLAVLQVVLLPVTVGVVLKRGLPGVAQRIEPVMPPLAVMAIVMIVSSIVGSQTAVLRQQGPVLILACLLLHGGGFLLGWLIPRLAGQSVQAQRTISIEVGMQNSGLAVVLARSGGFASPLTALPGAISAVIHCLIGSALAAVWRRRRSPCLAVEARCSSSRLGRVPVVEFKQQAGGEATGDAPCHEQIADPGEQRRRIGCGCQALFEGLQLLHVAAAPQGIDQGVFSRPRLGELRLVTGIRGAQSPPSWQNCHGTGAVPLSWPFLRCMACCIDARLISMGPWGDGWRHLFHASSLVPRSPGRWWGSMKRCAGCLQRRQAW